MPHLKYCSSGIGFIKHIHDNNDNLRGFEIEDVDGYVLFLVGPIHNVNYRRVWLLFDFIETTYYRRLMTLFAGWLNI